VGRQTISRVVSALVLAALFALYMYSDYARSATMGHDRFLACISPRASTSSCLRSTWAA
jgi:hypothetical protein